MPSALALSYRFDSSVQAASLIYDDNQNTNHNVNLLAAGGNAALSNLKYGENQIRIVYSRDNGNGTSTSYTVQFKLYIAALSLYTPAAVANGATVPVFNAGIRSYTAAASSGTNQVRMQFQAADPYSTLEVRSNDAPIADDGSGYLVSLSEGWNRVVVRLNRLGLGDVIDVYTIDVYQGDDAPDGYSLSLSGTAVPNNGTIALAPDASRTAHWLGQSPAGATQAMLAPVAALSDTYIGGVYLVKNGWWEWVNATAQGSGIYPIPLEAGSARVYVLVNKYGRPPLVYELEISP